MRKLIIIPAYNEAKSLPNLIENIEKTLPDFDYVIINDGSWDGTKKIGNEENWNIVHLPINSGIGVAVQTRVPPSTGKGKGVPEKHLLLH